MDELACFGDEASSLIKLLKQRDVALVAPGDIALVVDSFLDSVERFHKSSVGVLSSSEVDLIVVGEKVFGLSYWKKLREQYKVKSDFRLYHICMKRASQFNGNAKTILLEPLLETMIVDEDSSYHKFLLERARNENVVYGFASLELWTSFILAVSKVIPLEMKLLFGIFEKLDFKPFKIKKQDNSRIEWVNGFYNIVKITETLLNISVLRYGLTKRIIRLGSKDVDLFHVLDEAALVLGASPSVIIKELKEYLNFVARVAGINSNHPATLTHDQFIRFPDAKIPILILKDVPASTMKLFWNSSSYRSRYIRGKNILKTYSLNKLDVLIDNMLVMSLNDTSKDDFTIACSFILKYLALAGYSRSYVSLPPEEFPEMTNDKYNLAERFKMNIVKFHNEAVASGYLPISSSDWPMSCLSVWRSTSAGVAPETFEINLNGNIQSVKIKKKLAIGMKMGLSGFKRKESSKTLDIFTPGTIGYRDVPSKATIKSARADEFQFHINLSSKTAELITVKWNII